MLKRSYIYIILLVFVLVSCEKEIDVKLDDVEPKLVVEGVIENGEYAYVSLSKSTPYFSPVDTNTFNEMFIKDALVIVSDGIDYDTLTYDTVLVFPPFRFQGSKIIGELNKTYTLRIDYEGQTYTSQTQILDLIPIDSVKYEYEFDSDSLGYLWFYANDPANRINYYRYSVLDLNVDFTKELPMWLYTINSVTNDKFFDGRLIEGRTYKGRNPLKSREYYEKHSEDWWAFKMNEEYLIKLSHIDYQTFMFWKTAERVINTGDNPFSSPTTVQTNIEPNALGSWCGYASSVVQVKITKDMLKEN